jgi:hypothetical protein
MNRDGRSSSNDPTAEGKADGATPAGSVLPAFRPEPNVEPVPASEEEVLNRQTADTTPRRYEQPLAEDADEPVMPAADSTLTTKI